MGGKVAPVARDMGISRRQARKMRAGARPFLERAGLDPK
jgi:hypothetical protein